MENIAAAAILDVLSSGRDPSTGKVLSPDSVLLQDVVVKALQAGARALRSIQATNCKPSKPVQTASPQLQKIARTTSRPPTEPVPSDHPLYDRRYQGASPMEIVIDTTPKHIPCHSQWWGYHYDQSIR